MCTYGVFNGTLSVAELLTVIANKIPYLADRVFFRQQAVLFLYRFIHCEDRTFFTLVVCCTGDLQIQLQDGPNYETYANFLHYFPNNLENK
jgi:hypothetical protein